MGTYDATTQVSPSKKFPLELHFESYKKKAFQVKCFAYINSCRRGAMGQAKGWMFQFDFPEEKSASCILVGNKRKRQMMKGSKSTHGANLIAS